MTRFGFGFGFNIGRKVFAAIARIKVSAVSSVAAIIKRTELNAVIVLTAFSDVILWKTPGASPEITINCTAEIADNYDPDAVIFFPPTGITDSAVKTATSNLFLELKTGPLHGNNIWSKTDSFKPIVGGNSVAHSIDGKTPASQQMTYTNNPTHDGDGIRFNGIDQDAYSGYDNTSINTSNFSKFVFIKSETSLATNSPFGVYSGGPFIGIERNTANFGRYFYAADGGVSVPAVAGNFSGLVGVGRKNSATAGRYEHSILTEYSSTVTGGTVTRQTRIGVFDVNGGTSQRFTGVINFIWEGRYLSQSEFEDLEQAIINFNTALSR